MIIRLWLGTARALRGRDVSFRLRMSLQRHVSRHLELYQVRIDSGVWR